MLYMCEYTFMHAKSIAIEPVFALVYNKYHESLCFLASDKLHNRIEWTYKNIWQETMSPIFLKTWDDTCGYSLH